jgi:hypothetical protein
LIADVLDHVSGPGFREFFKSIDNFNWSDAQEYRQRFMLRALRGHVPVL